MAHAIVSWLVVDEIRFISIKTCANAVSVTLRILLVRCKQTRRNSGIEAVFNSALNNILYILRRHRIQCHKIRWGLTLKQIGVSLPDDIVRRLSDDAADLQIPISALCRILILHSLDKCDLKGITQDRDKNEF